MNNKDIIDDLVNGCPSAPKMTSALKKIGNGDMKNGLKTIMEHSTEEGIKEGSIKGIMAGISSTLVIFLGIAGIKKLKAWIKDHKEKGEEIIQGFEQSSNDDKKIIGIDKGSDKEPDNEPV